jgi:hypothetical protein
LGQPFQGVYTAGMGDTNFWQVYMIITLRIKPDSESEIAEIQNA